MKMVKFSLTLVTCAMLAACGSSGGSDNHSEPNHTATNNTSSTSNNSNNSATNTPSSTNSTHTGHASVVKAVGDGEAVSVTKVKLSDPSLTKINVEGKDITIGYPNIFSGSWSDINIRDASLKVCCGSYSDIRFGVYESGENDHAYFFHNGNPTKNMPASGLASYNGHVIIAGDTPHFDDEDYLKGSTQFTADFANKTLEGSLNVDTMKAINVKANISGNNFAGTASSTDFDTSANVNGKFYGDNAKELSGVFHDGKTWGGAFGAAKTK